ncbi:MAG: hypothetical protein EXR80_07285 [Methylococcales bacterium]|nr:hypothetical protein [Methylococcales bacterium]
MEAHAKFNIKKAFVLKSDDIAKLWKIFEDNGMEVIATITCSADCVRKFEKCETLNQYENAKSSNIIQLDIEGKCNNPYTRAKVSFGYLDFKPIHISICCDESLVLAMRMKVGDVLHGIKPWYSCISTMNFLNAIFIVVLLINIFIFFVPFFIPSLAAKPKSGISSHEIYDILSILNFGGLLIFGINCLRNKLFPLNTFAIGQGLVRHEFNEKIRWAGLTFIIGLPYTILKFIS